MKTYNHLCPQIAGFANLDEAWHKARRGSLTGCATVKTGPTTHPISNQGRP